MRKIKIKKDSEENIKLVTFTNKMATEKNAESKTNERIDDLLEEVDRIDEGYSIIGNEKKKNFRNIRKFFVVNDKIIDKEL